jgi:hypothetical protein
MDRRYQVFISSTYMDLVEERREVIQALLEMDCLPAGMEMFPAASDDQWTLIQQVIDESDYYVVIVGGRYGSVAPDGISYTEKEYDYAVSTGKPVLGFVHSNPGQIPLNKSQPDAQKELDAFTAKVKSRLVKMYSSPAELGSGVSRSLVMTIKKHPAEGWVRGQYAMTPETQAEISELRAQVSELRLEARATAAAQQRIPEGLASGDDPYDITGTLVFYRRSDLRTGAPTYTLDRYQANVAVPVTWNEVFGYLGPKLMNEATETELRIGVTRFCREVVEDAPGRFMPGDFGAIDSFEMREDVFQDVIVQLFALNLITHGLKKRSATDRSKYWALTTLGQDVLMKLRAIRK